MSSDISSEKIIQNCVRQYLKAANIFSSRRLQTRSALSPKGSRPFEKDRDPVKLGEVIGGLVKSLDHENYLGKASLQSIWSEVIGEYADKHTWVSQITHKGELIIGCDSRVIVFALPDKEQIIEKLNSRYPEARIEKITFLPPESKRGNFGPRRVINNSKHYE